MKFSLAQVVSLLQLNQKMLRDAAEAEGRDPAAYDGDVLICLEPADVLKQKQAEGKGQELWVLDPAIAVIARGDGKFYEVIMTNDAGGYFHPVIREEPQTVKKPKVIGYIFIELRADNRVRFETKPALGGSVIQFPLGSVSNLKTPQPRAGEEPVGYVAANPQRITRDGLIAVYVRRNAQFADSEAMTVAEFRDKSDDGRSLSALGKAGIVD